MKTKEEIEQLAKNRNETDPTRILAFIKGYTQCQADVIELLKEEIRRAFLHGQTNSKMMESGLERDEVEGYTNWRIRILNK